MSTYHLEVITRDRVFYEGEVNRIVIKGVEGDLAILANHTPLVTILDIGPLKIFGPDKKVKEASLTGGFIQVNPTHVTIMADAAEWPEEIDKARAEKAAQRAEEYLKKKDEFDYARANAALKRALLRIDIVDKK